MADYFFDTSALVKRYIAEPGSGWVRRIFAEEGNGLYIAVITGPETISAVIRRENRGDISADQSAQLRRQFREEWQEHVQILGITFPVIVRAMGFAEKYGLRGYDAVQLAVAMDANRMVQRLGLPSLVFVSADDALNVAAVSEGLSTVNPNETD